MAIASNGSTSASPNASLLGKAQLQLAGVLQQRLDHELTTFVDNNYDEGRVMYFSAELEF